MCKRTESTSGNKSIRYFCNKFDTPKLSNIGKIMRNLVKSTKNPKKWYPGRLQKRILEKICLADAFWILSGCFLGRLVGFGCHFGASWIFKGIQKSIFGIDPNKIRKNGVVDRVLKKH